MRLNGIGMQTRGRATCRVGLSTLSAGLVGAALVGCMVGPDYRRPRPDVPVNWIGPTGAARAPASQPSVANTQPVEITRWWASFGDPTLDSLVDRSIKWNLDLRIASSRIRQARAARRIAQSGLFPTVDTSAAYRRTGSSTTVPRAGGGTRRVDLDRGLFEAGLDAGWEIDVFGGVRRGVEAAAADIQAVVEDRRDLLVVLTSEVAVDYIELRGLQRQIAIARENLVSQRRSYDLTRRRAAGGFESGLDVANAQALVASTESQLPLLEAAQQQTIYALSELLGLEPGALVQELTAQGAIPGTPPEVPVGLPSDLLRRRPDIRRAEAQLHAATARVGVATADLFPRFSLTGSLNFQAGKFTGLFDWDNRSWSIGPSVRWPLFDAGRIRANIEVQNEAQEQALLNYRATILGALHEVEDALVAYAREQEHRAALADAVAANRRAVELSTRLYTQGQTDFLNVLSAQRSLYGSENALVDSDRTVATNLVAIYKALGGGWEVEPDAPPRGAATQPATRPANETRPLSDTLPATPQGSPMEMRPVTTRPAGQ